jgi:N-acyl homoserine lactone hydrolase
MTGLRMSAMNVGPLSVDTNLLVAFAPGHLEIPTTAVVIVHPTHGVGLWDTAIHGAVADTERRVAYWGVNAAASAFAPHTFRREHAVDAQLERLGIKPKEVPYVLYSHLHLDHVGGMSYFPDAIHVVQRDAIRYAMSADTWTCPYRKSDPLAVDRESGDAAARCLICANLSLEQ